MLFIQIPGSILAYQYIEDIYFFDWLVGWFGFNRPLRQCFSLYRVVSQREGERGEKG